MLKPKQQFTLLKVGNIILWIFIITSVAAAVYYIPFAYNAIKSGDTSVLPRILLTIIAEIILFWIGIIIVYACSIQLGIKIRILGIVFGMVPIAHLIMLFIILRRTGKEAKYELARCKLNEIRSTEKVCQTKYPILMVHGVFFRDYKHFNYWGRIPGELIRNGAAIYYGEHHSAASVDDCANELEKRILKIIRESGCDKLNVIAHSKGGLDMRTAISKTTIAPYIASLTTINTPHRGCEFADYLINVIPEHKQKTIAAAYNKMASKLGDTDPDFMTAVKDLTASACKKRNDEVKDCPDVYYQSVGSVMSRPTAGRFPLNMTYHLVNIFDGKNDGLVGESSFEWGDNFELLSAPGRRGISHGDMIDLNRENIDGFDVREFFVALVSMLKERGF